jgi:uncharacterized C2H2 Zn-finger protein
MSQRFLQAEELLSHYLALHLSPAPTVPEKPKATDLPPEDLLHQDSSDSRRTDFKNVCPLCNSSFIALRNLQRHMESAHSDLSSATTGDVKDQDLACKDCGKRFSSRYNLERHLQLHRGVRYPCAACGKIYTQKYAWSQHMKVTHKGWSQARGLYRAEVTEEELIGN